MSSSLFSSFQGNTKCESSFFADTCTLCVPIFLNRDDEKWSHTRQIKIAGRNHILPSLGIENTLIMQS